MSYFIQSAIAPTSRSTLELLNLPFPFSQVDLLQPSEFVRAAAQRRVTMWGGRDLDESGLHELHRCRVIVPFYCVSIGDDSASSPIDASQSDTPRHVHSTFIDELYSAATNGRLTDPATEPFVAWPTERVRMLWPTAEKGYLYSYHQLLSLDGARSIVGILRTRLRADHRPESFLPDDEIPDEDTLETLDSLRSLAITLAAIDTRVWPGITHVIRHNAEVWRSTNLAQHPQDLATWLGVTAEVLRAQSEQLRLNASFRDVLGDFYEVVRRAGSEAWTTLRGDARRAMDQRMAAEALDHFADELEGFTVADRPSVPSPLSQQGLAPSERSLDRVLTDLHLSPHSPLVVALEGKTEMTLFPRVLAKLGIPSDPTWMTLVDFEGTKDLSLLARLASQPHLGDDHGDFVLLDRPVTRFLVLTDAENKFATPGLRAKQRSILLDSITKELPRDLRRDLRSRDSRLVEILTWGRLPFEFAHFTDAQLADALLRLRATPYPRGRDELIARVSRERRSATPNVDDVWRPPGTASLKVALAHELWPVLEKRIGTAIRRNTRGPRVMQAALRAYQLATLSHRQSVAVRRHHNQ